jgi:putative tricarboxylic transport membrane protein
MQKANLAIAVILLAFCAAYACLTAQLPARNLPNTLGIAFVPWVLVILLGGLSLILLLKSVLAGSTETSRDETSAIEAARILILTAVVVVYAYATTMVGFLLATPIMLALLMLLTGSRSWKEILITSLTVTFGIYFFFQKVFQILLPRGDLF